MTLSDAPLREPLATEITTVLIDLAALTKRAAWTAYAQLDAVSNDMLQRVLALCKARRGAVLLSEDHASPRTHEEDAQSAPIHIKALRTLALYNIQEEEAYALLQAFPATNTLVQSPDLTSWIAYRLALNDVAIGGAGDTDGTGNAPGIPIGASTHAEQGQHALLVLGWVNESNDTCASLVARCQTLLPLVADPIGAVIAGIVLRERVHDLERTAVRESLQGMELLKSELLGTVSHELRSPLTSVKGYAATLLRHERRLGREERHQFLLAINEASDRLETIIERLLEVSQLETGQVTIDRAPVDLARLVGEAIEAIEERVEAASPGRFMFSLRLKQADGTPADAVPLILANPRRLREVLDNLLKNAVNYSPEGGSINVTLRPVVQMQPGAKGAPSRHNGEETTGMYVPRDMLELCVSDSGQGIPVEHLSRIFDRFHRVDTRLTRETSGLGLGLTICKRIVELHDGSIWAENRPHGEGSAFYVQLPLDQPLEM
ncbi:MAG TPA: ATP-binding protein [Ktedonobacteraceae bacterium]|nr:ATP-binding protein [Ktedonobacteraceae bacterium]